MGTVYTPPEVIDPTVGVVHVTEVLLAPLTAALNAADWPFVMEIHDGLTDTVTVGIRLMVAFRTGTEGAVALRVTLVGVVILDGAVYCPAAEMLPKLGLIDHEYLVFPALLTENS